MRRLMGDSRMMLVVLMADGIDAGARGLFALWRRSMRTDRLARQLRYFEAAGWIGRPRPGSLDVRAFQLTTQGKQEVAGGVDPETLWSRPWDGVWRMVLFDVPQAHTKVRTRLRRKLRALRFGWLQNSVWLSPDPVAKLGRSLEKERLNVENLLFIDARPGAGERDADLVAGAWDFGRIAKLHAAYLKVLRLRPSVKLDARPTEWATWLDAEQRAWGEIIRQDPFLPERLWPEGYAGRAVWRARQEALLEAGEAIARATPRAASS